MCAPSPPPPPDYTAAAKETAAGNLEAARANSAANKVSQYTPYGNLVYKTSGKDSYGNDMWSATQSLDPAQQQLLNSTNNLNLGLMNTAGNGLQYANNVLSHPGVNMSTPGQANMQGIDKLNPNAYNGMEYLPKNAMPDQSQLPQTGFNPGEMYQYAMMQRLAPQIQRENQASDAQLANQGIGVGSEAYTNSKNILNQSHNDLLNNATTQGFNTGLAANNQAYNQALGNNVTEFGQAQAANQQRLEANQAQFGQGAAANQQTMAQNSQGLNAYNAALAGNAQNFQQQAYNQMQPINVINALRSGAQVQGPQFANVPQQAYTGGPDLLGAAQAQYGAQMGGYNGQVGNYNSMLGGMFSLGSSGMMAYAM